MSEEYEFDSEEEKIFIDFNYRSIMLAGMVLLLGIVSLFAYFINQQGLVAFFISLFLIIIAFAFYLPSYNLKKIVDSKGKDITELMSGIDKFIIGWGIMVGILLVYRIIMFVQLFD